MSNLNDEAMQSELRRANLERELAIAQRDSARIQRDSAIVDNMKLKSEVTAAQVWAARSAVELNDSLAARSEIEGAARTNGTALSLLLGCIALLLVAILVWYFMASSGTTPPPAV